MKIGVRVPAQDLRTGAQCAITCWRGDKRFLTNRLLLCCFRLALPLEMCLARMTFIIRTHLGYGVLVLRPQRCFCGGSGGYQPRQIETRGAGVEICTQLSRRYI